ncbi:MAG: RlmE family RNA methyltransferase [bacterium]
MAGKDYKKPDHYADRAKKDGYAARSVYKLREIDDKEGLVRPGNRVLDLGASPGSWMQYLSKKVGKKGLVVGVDIKPLATSLPENARFLEADVHELSPERLKEYAPRFDRVVCDMLPNTIGHKDSDHLRCIALAESALLLTDRVLRPGGHFLIKVLQGSEFEQFRDMLKERYDKVKIKKPKSSRKISREVYLLGLGKKPEKGKDQDDGE